MHVCCHRGIHQGRIKQLSKTISVPDYVEVLPASPRDLLRSHPEVANMLFDAENLPVPSPLNQTLVAQVRAMMVLRGGNLQPKIFSTQAGMAAPMNSFAPMLQGPCKYVQGASKE